MTHGYFDRNRALHFLSNFTRILLFLFEKWKFCKKEQNMDHVYQLPTGKHCYKLFRLRSHKKTVWPRNLLSQNMSPEYLLQKFFLTIFVVFERSECI